MLEELFDLPDSWIWTTVSEIISDAQSGFASGKKDVPDGIPHLRMNNIGSDCRLNLDSVLTVPNELAKPRYLLEYGDILFCHTNSAKLVGKTALFDLDESKPYAFSNHLTRLRVEQGIAPEWLWHVLATLWRERYFENRCKQWVNQATIERDTLLEAPLPLPPSREQRRIAEKIEALFEQSRTAREALDAIPALLRQFRQAVLAAAFRGELSTRDPDDEPASALLERILEERRRRWEADLRAKGKDPRRYTYPEPVPPDTSDLPELPEGWCWATLDMLAEVRTGVAKGRDLRGQNTIEVPYLRVANVQAGYLDLTEVKTIQIKDSELERYSLMPNDVLFTEGGDRDKLGRGTVWLGEVTPCIHQNHIFSARLYTDHVAPYWVSLASQLPYARDYFWAVASQTVNLASVSATNLRGFPIPIVSSQTQHRILERINTLLSLADGVELAVEIARHRLDRLDQSILARVFRGELVPQDPDDEPASVLLERIRAERSRRAGERSSRRKDKGRK